MRLGKSVRLVLVLALLSIVSLSAMVGAQPVLKHMGSWDRFDPNNDPVTRVLEEVTGYKVEYFMLPAENANEVLSLRISSPGAYDSLKLNVSQYNMLTAQGALMPLDDLLKEHGQRILEVISPESWETAKVNGKIYGIPEKNGENINTALIVRLDVLEDLGLEIPETLDEFYQVLKAIRAEKNMLPLAMADYEVQNEMIQSAFGLYTPWLEHDDKIISPVEHPGMKEYLTFMKKLYDENLIDQDFPVNNRQQAIQKFTSGQAAMMRFAWWEAPSVIPALESNVPGAKVAFILPLIGPNGEQGIQVTRGIGWYAAIPQGTKNAVDVIKWWNAKLDLAGHKQVAIGTEGVHHTKQDGKYYPILPIFETELNNGSWFLTGIDENLYPGYWQARVRKNPLVAETYDIIMSVLPTAGKFDPLAFAPALPTVARYTQSLSVLIRDSQINFVAGGESLDRYDNFVKQWQRAGGEVSAKEINEWWQTR